MSKKLAISIITYNRPKHIQEYLNYIIKPTQEKNIDIYIYDGSTNRATEHIVDGFINKGYNHVLYFHYEEDAIHERINDAILKPDAKYIWFCGDKFIINPINYDTILEHIDRDYDIITMYDCGLNGTKYSNNSVEYVKYSIVPFTHFGAVIIKKELLSEEVIDRYNNSYPAFARMRSYIEIATKKDFRGATLHLKDLRILSKYKTRSASESMMWEVWVIQWYNMINSIPKAYDNVKDDLFCAMDKRMIFFSMYELLKQREEQQFDFKMCRQNKKIVNKVICLPYIIVECISILTPGMAKVIRKLLEFQN